MYEESHWVKQKHPCSKCTSSDAASTDNLGWTYCFACRTSYREDGNYGEENEQLDDDLLDYQSSDLRKRGLLRRKTCAKYGYGVGHYFDEPVQVANYRSRGKIVAQHLRTADKDFPWLGSLTGLELFGQHLWKEGGKEIIITEGEIDCLTWAQTRDLRWPVVGVPGISSIKMIKHNLNWLSTFKKIYISFDMDKPGRKFAEEVAALLPPGTAYIISTGQYKDANEMYQAEGQQALYGVLWQATLWRPAELTSAMDVLDNDTEVSAKYRYDWPSLQENLHGVRSSELTLICAGTNVGKSLVSKTLAYQFLKQGYKVGFIALEETSALVLDTFLCMESGKSVEDMVFLPKGDKRFILSQAEWKDNITFYTDRGEDIVTAVLPRIRYMALANEVDIIFIDHISAIFSLMQGKRVEEIDRFMYSLHSLCKEVDTPVFAVAHLRDPQVGPTHAAGGMPDETQLKGSSSISREADNILGVRRNVKDREKREYTEMFILKSRLFGLSVGNSFWLKMNDKSQLMEVSKPKFKEDEDEPDYGF